METKNKRLMTTMAVILGTILIIVVIFFLVRNKREDDQKEIKTPDTLLNTQIEQDDSIVISDFGDSQHLQSSAPIYYAENITNVSLVEQFIDNMGFNEERNKAVVENHYSWGDSNSDAYFNYSPENNMLDVNIRSSIKSVTNLTRNNAEEVLNNYLNGLGMKYEYKVLKLENTDEYITAYLSRKLGDYQIETSNQYGYTDYLVFSTKGELLYARIMFTKFTNKLNYSVPLIDTEKLFAVINDEDYPKEIRVDDLDFIDFAVPKNNGYIEGELSSDANTVVNSVKDCEPTNISLIYYYPNQTGVYILPTYKINCISTAEYKDVEYSVSSIVYTNAVSPEYISSEQ